MHSPHQMQENQLATFSTSNIS